MSIKLRPVLGTTVVITMLMGCATEVGNPKKPGSGGDDDDSALALRSELIATELDDTMSLVDLEINSLNLAATGANLVGDDGGGAVAAFPLSRTSERTCDEATDGQSATATHSLSKSDSRTMKRRGKSVTVQLASVITATNHWFISEPSASINCNSDDKARIPWLQVTSATQQKTLHRDSTRAISLPNGLKDKLMKSNHVVADKTATITHSRSTAGGVTTLERSMAFSATYSYNFVTGAEKAVTAKTTVAAPADTPIVSRLTFEGGALTSRTIVSGTQSSTKGDDGKTTKMTFSNVSFSSAADCQPTSGTITGQILAADQSVEENFTITFAEGEGTIVYTESGKQDTYTQECMN